MSRIALRTEGLYAIVDVDAWRARGVELAREGVLEAVALAVLQARPSALQLRAKHETSRDVLALLRRLRPLTAKAGVAVVANDRADLALLAEADALHVGQDDLPLEEVRRIAPGLPCGLSTHDGVQLAAALAARPAYVAFGPVFGTGSKEGASPVVGVEALSSASARARAAGVPLVAIGGIDLERAAPVAAAGARWAAVISALVSARDGAPDLPEVTRRACALEAALSRGRA